MSAAASSTERGEPNLTPVLDMVFQLITFFMLVINFKAASMDLSLNLPVVGSARPIDNPNQADFLILNIDREGTLTVYGLKQDLAKYIAAEARNTRDLLAAKGQPLSPGAELPTTVVLRADKETPFSTLKKVFKECQAHGYRKFSLKAMTKVETKGAA